jgi:hypothetical protein
VYSFLGYIYYLNNNRKLNREDLDKIEKGDFANKILLAIDDFDNVTNTPKPSADFFKKLGEVKWEDKRTKKFFDSITNLHFVMAFNTWGGENVAWDFPATEKAFLGLLSGCSAVLDERERINSADVIRAEKTYLKLIDTDLTKLM